MLFSGFGKLCGTGSCSEGGGHSVIVTSLQAPAAAYAQQGTATNRRRQRNRRRARLDRGMRTRHSANPRKPSNGGTNFIVPKYGLSGKRFPYHCTSADFSVCVIVLSGQRRSGELSD